MTQVNEWSLPDAGDYDDEDAYNGDTDKYDRRKVRVTCPCCQNVASPLCSTKTQQTSNGWRWVGCDHKEPYCNYRATCRKCRKEYRFTTYVPQ